MAADVDALVLRIAADATALKAQLAMAGKSVDAFSMKAVTQFKAIGTGMAMVGRKMTSMVTLPIVAGAAASTAAFAHFDSAMTTSTAIITEWGDVTRQEMEAVAIAMSERSVQSATELAEAYFFLASAGLNARQQIEALPIVTAFATAGMFDMSQATDLLTDAFSALGLKQGPIEQQMQNMTFLGDQLVRANTLANASVEQFSTALTTKAGAAMKAFNIEASEGIAVLAAMADQGIKAQLAGNGLDRILRLMNKSALKNKEAHKALGFEVFDEAGNMNHLGNIMLQLETITGDMSAELKAATLDMLGFDAKVQGMILPLIGTSDAIMKYDEELQEAGGTTEDVANKQLESFTAQMTMLWNSIKNTGREIGKKFAPMVAKMVEGIEAATTWYSELSEGMKTTILVILGIVAAIGPLLIIFGSMIALASGLTLIMKALATAYGFATVKTLALAAAKKVLAIATALAGKAIMAVPYVAAAIAIAAVVAWVYKLSAETAEYNKQADRRNKLDKQFADMKQKEQTKQLEGLEELEGEDKVKRLKEMINKSTKEVSGYRMQVSQSARNVAELAPTWKSAYLAGKSVHNLAIEDGKAAQDRLDSQIAHQKVLKDMLLDEERAVAMAKEKEEIEKRRFESEGGIPRAAMADEIISLDKINKKLIEERDTFGMTNSEIDIYRARVKGATEAQLEELIVIQEANDAIQEEIEAREKAAEAAEKQKQTYNDMKESLDEEIATFGMSAHELRMYKAEQDGLSEIEKDVIAIKSKKLESMKAEKKLMEKGKQLTQSMMTPEEKFAKGQEELNKMLASGAIDLETYTRAMEKLEKDTTVKVKFKVSGIDAVAAGSAEAMARLEEFRALTKDDKQKVDFKKDGEAIKAKAEAEKAAAMAEAIKLEAIAAFGVTDNGLPPSVDPAAHAAELAGGKPNIMEEWMANNDPFAHLKPKSTPTAKPAPGIPQEEKEGAKNLAGILTNTKILAERTPVVIEEARL